MMMIFTQWHWGLSNDRGDGNCAVHWVWNLAPDHDHDHDDENESFADEEDDDEEEVGDYRDDDEDDLWSSPQVIDHLLLGQALCLRLPEFPVVIIVMIMMLTIMLIIRIIMIMVILMIIMLMIVMVIIWSCLDDQTYHDDQDNVLPVEVLIGSPRVGKTCSKSCHL